MELEGEALAKYTILDLKIIPTLDLNKNVEWICKSFGFLESRDKDKTAAKIFKVLLEAAKTGEGLSSDELAEKIGLTRGTIIHHLNKLRQSGLILHRSSRYELRAVNLQRTIQELKRDLNRVFENIEQIAHNIDENLKIAY